MDISASLVKELREKTGSGMMDCKKALQECRGDMEKAVDYLRQKGQATLSKRMQRTALEGMIGSYIHHGGKIGVLVEVNCETDFVARTEEFQNFIKDLCMQIAASNPLYLSPEDVPGEMAERERAVLRAQALESGKPEKIVDRIVEGRIQKFYQENCLLEQAFVKDDKISIKQLLEEVAGKLGEKMAISRFTRFQVGEAQGGDGKAGQEE